MSSERSLVRTYGEDRFVDRFVVSYRSSGLGQSQGDIGLYGKAYMNALWSGHMERIDLLSAIVRQDSVNPKEI